MEQYTNNIVYCIYLQFIIKNIYKYNNMKERKYPNMPKLRINKGIKTIIAQIGV